METFFNQQNNHGTMDEDGDPCGVSSSSSSDVSGDSIASSLSDLAEDAASGSSSSLSSTSSADRIAGGPLYEMSTMMNQLPFKRGLSKHFQGKSQSFSSLSKVRSLEDLAKQEKPHKKGKWCSRGISKKASRASFSSSHTTKRNTSFLLCNKLPQIPVPQRHGSLSSLKPLFA